MNKQLSQNILQPFLSFLCLLISTLSFGQSESSEKNSQTNVTISGSITDLETGEDFIGATIKTTLSGQLIGAVTNEYGFYSLSLPQGVYQFNISYPEYQRIDTAIALSQSIALNFQLKMLGTVTKIEEVVVKAKRTDDNLSKAQMGAETLEMSKLEKIPVVFGERDLIRAFTTFPGVKSSSEAGGGISVRGGATDQNLILLDEANVYNASHLLGFFSTFNPDALKDATIIKGNSPANYGGRLASVLDVKMKEGNNKDFGVNGGIGMISSRLTVQGPLKKDKSSFIVSGRRTYADLFLKMTDDFKDTKLYFYDLNAKANIRLNEKNKLFLSGYFGRDVLGFGDNFGVNWGNATGTIRWNHLWSKKVFSNTSVIYSDYDYKIELGANNNSFEVSSNVKDLSLKQDFSWYLNPKNTIKFGFQAIHHSLMPNAFEFDGNESDAKPRQSLENAIYLDNYFKPNDRFSIDYGLRLSSFSLLGGEVYNIYENGVLVDTRNIEQGTIGKTYFILEPRFITNYRLTESISLKGAYSRNSQNLHLLSNSTAGNPSDLWIGNSFNVKPEIADQVSLGYSQNFKKDRYELAVETYYKNMQNQIDYKNGADIITTPDVESQLLYGVGRAYGLELIVKKKEGRFSGWLSYTLSKTERKIEGINNNNWYNARQDRTHDISIVGIYELSQRWSLSALFVYNTGNAVTLPIGKYEFQGNTIFAYGERNADRMPATHRLDFSATYTLKKRVNYEHSLNIGLYNVYGRQNPYSLTYRDSETNPGTVEVVQTSLFRWVPNLTYNFKF